MPDDPTNIVAFDNIPDNLVRALQAQHGELTLIHTADQMDKYLSDPNLRFILGRSELKLDGQQMDRAKSLAMIAKCCIGTDGLSFGMAAERGVIIVNSRQAKNSVAEMAVEFALGISRNTIGSIIETCIDVPKGKLRKRAENRHELHSMRVGIVGAGQIGQLTAEKMRPLAREIFMYDDAPNAKEKIGERGTMVANLDELLERSDIVIVHADDTDNQGHSNSDLITAERLRGKNVFGMINLAREEILTVVEMIKAIENGYIQRARTDVYPKKHEGAKQWECPIPREMVMSGQFVGTAHIGASTEEVQKNIGEDIAEKLDKFRKHRDISSGLNFNSTRFNNTDQRNSIVFQHSTQPGTLGILADALGHAGINIHAAALQDMQAIRSKGQMMDLSWGLTRIDTNELLDETQIGRMLEELKAKNNGFELHHLTVIDRKQDQ